MTKKKTIAKVFALWLRTTNPHEKAIRSKWLRENGATNTDCFYWRDGQRHTVHGDISFVKEGESPPPAPEPQPQYTTYTPPRAQEVDRDAPPPNPTRPLRTTPQPREKTYKEFLRDWSDHEARSVMERRNKGLF
jgi:hypothetical protein